MCVGGVVRNEQGFQFQFGAIKRTFQTRNAGGRNAFQFQFGAIKSPIWVRFQCMQIGFQFQFGAIKRFAG